MSTTARLLPGVPVAEEILAQVAAGVAQLRAAGGDSDVGDGVGG